MWFLNVYSACWHTFLSFWHDMRLIFMPSEQMMLISALKPFPRIVEKFHDTISIFDFSKKGLGPSPKRKFANFAQRHEIAISQEKQLEQETVHLLYFWIFLRYYLLLFSDILCHVLSCIEKLTTHFRTCSQVDLGLLNVCHCVILHLSLFITWYFKKCQWTFFWNMLPTDYVPFVPCSDYGWYEKPHIEIGIFW